MNRGMFAITLALSVLIGVLVDTRTAYAVDGIASGSGTYGQAIFLGWGSWNVQWTVTHNVYYNRFPTYVQIVGTPAQICILHAQQDWYMGYSDDVLAHWYINDASTGGDIDYDALCRGGCSPGFWPLICASGDWNVDYSNQLYHYPPYGTRGRAVTCPTVQASGNRYGACAYWESTYTSLFTSY